MTTALSPPRGRPRALLAALLATLLSCAGLVVGTPSPASAAPGNMIPPFDIGTTWNICQGYGGAPSHTGNSLYGLDLTGAGCDNSATGRNVRVPISGTVAYAYQASYGNLCINITGSNRSYTLTHINLISSFAGNAGSSVTAGQLVGTVAAAGNRGNNNLAHLHFQLWNASGCYNSSPIPFDSAHGARICGAPDLSPGQTGGQGTWSGTAFTGESCGTPPVSGRADFNTDTRSDIAAAYGYNDGSVNLQWWSGHPGKVVAHQPTAWSGAGWDGVNRIKPVGVGDVDGDSHKDMVTFFRHDNGGMDMNVWYGNGQGGFGTNPGRPWTVPQGSGWMGELLVSVGVGRFDGDDKTDVVAMYRYNDGRVNLYVWKGQAGRTPGSMSPTMVWHAEPGTGWDGSRIMPAGVGDYDGDGHTDVITFYRHDNGGMDMNVYNGNGTIATDAYTLSRPWFMPSGSGWDGNLMAPAGVGRLDSDNKADVFAFYRYSATGTSLVNLYAFKGQSRSVTGIANIATPWHAPASEGWNGSRIMPAGVGDYDGDGDTDVATFYDHDGYMMDMNVFYGASGTDDLTRANPWHVDTGYDGSLMKPIMS